MRLRVYPKERISPIVREFYLNQMIAARASRSIGFEYCFGARATAFDMFEDEGVSFVSSDARRAACFADVSHFHARQFFPALGLYVGEMGESYSRQKFHSRNSFEMYSSRMRAFDS